MQILFFLNKNHETEAERFNDLPQVTLVVRSKAGFLTKIAVPPKF